MLTEQELIMLKNFANALIGKREENNDNLGLVPTPCSNIRRIFVKAEGESPWYESCYNSETDRYINKPFGSPNHALKGYIRSVDIYFKKYEDGYGKDGDFKVILTMEADATYKIETGLFTISALSLFDRIRRLPTLSLPCYISPRISEEKKTIVFFECWDADGNLILTTPEALNMAKWQKQCIKIIEAIREKLNQSPFEADLITQVTNFMSEQPAQYATKNTYSDLGASSQSKSQSTFKAKLNALIKSMSDCGMSECKQKIIDICWGEFGTKNPNELDPAQGATLIKMVEAYIANYIDIFQSHSESNEF